MTLLVTQTTQCQVHTTKVSRFSQRCGWELPSFWNVMLHHQLLSDTASQTRRTPNLLKCDVASPITQWHSITDQTNSHSSEMWCCVTNYPVTQHHRPEEQVPSSCHYDCILCTPWHSNSLRLTWLYAQQICLSCKERHSTLSRPRMTRTNLQSIELRHAGL